MIKDLEQVKAYKYLSVDESSEIQHATMKQNVKRNLLEEHDLFSKLS